MKNSRLSFSDVGSSGFEVDESIYLIRKDLAMAMFFAFLVLFVCNLLKINMLLVEAAGVEPDISVENTQLTESRNASNSSNATIAKSAVQSLYKDCLEFPELQHSDFPAWCKSTLKRSCSISDVGRYKPQRNGDIANMRTLDLQTVSGELGKVGK